MLLRVHRIIALPNYILHKNYIRVYAKLICMQIYNSPGSEIRTRGIHSYACFHTLHIINSWATEGRHLPQLMFLHHDHFILKLYSFQRISQAVHNMFEISYYSACVYEKMFHSRFMDSMNV